MIEIAGFADIAADKTLCAQIETIFFVNAARKQFASDEARTDYHDIWLGRYLRHFPQYCLIAASDRNILGYLAGSPLSNAAPVAGPDYYDVFPARLVDEFPAHIHVNVAQEYRGQSIGAQLIAGFLRLCETQRLPGFHAVTANDSASARFFEQSGLLPRSTAIWRDRPLAFLGRRTRPR